MGLITVAVLIDLPDEHQYYAATLAALKHAARARSLSVQVDIVRTDQIEHATDLHDSALVIGPGSPYREPEAVLHAIRTAREQGVPLVGT